MTSPVREYRSIAGPSSPRAPSSSNFSRFTTQQQQHLHLHQETFQPRIVRGTVAPHGPPSIYTNGAGSPSRQPTRARRSSSAAGSAPQTGSAASLALALTQGHVPGGGANDGAAHLRKASLTASGSTTVGYNSSYGSPDVPISFPPPAYLEHSALRRYIQITPYLPSPPHSALHSYPHYSDTSDRGRDRPSLQIRSGSGRTSSGALRHRSLDDSDDDSASSDGEPRSPAIRNGRGVGPSRSPRGSSASASWSGQAAAVASIASGESIEDEYIQFPTRWSKDNRSSALLISSDGREVQFNGPHTTSEKEAAAVRANFPMPQACGIYYYEVEILNKGHKGHIGIGFGTAGVNLGRLPGWAQSNSSTDRPPESWGYHGDDGRSFASQDTGSPYGQKFSTGDIIGCGVDFTLRTAFYTKNGAFQGHVFKNVDGEIYPMIGLRTQGEVISTNFGHAPFKYDIESHVHQRRNTVWARIQSTPVTWSPASRSFVIPSSVRPSSSQKAESSAANSSTPTATRSGLSVAMNHIIHDYLSHHGYAGAARALKATIEAKQSTLKSASTTVSSGSLDIEMTAGVDASSFVREDSDVEVRQQIMAAIQSGDIDFALARTRERYPEAVEADGGWMLFRLRCRKFIELILEAAAALKIARKIEGGAALDIGARNAAISAQRPSSSSIEFDHPPAGKAAVKPVEFEAEEEQETGTDGDAMDVDEHDDRIVQQALEVTPSSSPTIPPSTPITPDNSVPTAHISRSAEKQREILRPPQSSEPHGEAPPPITVPSPSSAQIALDHALTYGRSLHADYEHDDREHVQKLFHRTFSLVAYENPLEVGGDVSRLAGQQDRELLAGELNEYILNSQGRNRRPVLERLFSHASATVITLGLRGNSLAAFADAEKEFLRD